MAGPFVLEQLEARGEIVGAGASPSDRAAEIVARANARAAEIEAEAQERGTELGRREGMAAAEAEVAELSAAVGAAVQALQTVHAEFVGTAELHAIELAIAIAEKVVGAALAIEPARVCDLVSGALRRIADRDRVVLELHPEDVEIVRDWLGAGSDSAWGTIEVHAERRIPRGGCIARTERGEIDARPSEQLARAEALLREAFAGRDT